MVSEAAEAGRHSLSDALQQVLERMEGIAGVEGAMIATRDGLLIAGSENKAERLDIKAAMVAAIFGAIDRAAENIDLGPIRAMLVETETGSLQMLSLSELLLVVVTQKSANMADVRAGLAGAAAQLARQAGPDDGV